jgi:transcriptional regulator with GAF, ATPase, and Fis domain
MLAGRAPLMKASLPKWTESEVTVRADRPTGRGEPTRLVTSSTTLITVVDGPSAGKSIETAGKPVRIGTSSDNQLVVDDELVSRQHCEIVPFPNGILVRDNGSTNGTFHGTVRLLAATFSEPFSLRIGATTIRVNPDAGTVDLERSNADRFGDLLGRSDCMRELFADLMRIAPSDASVLVEGETGTGKELVAESIHRASPRADHAFVVFDCGAVAPALVESDLFGHERGAFTGAHSARAGVFEQADKGTIFLDEIGELPKDLQPKLLRVLQKREVRRIGSNKTLAIDVRVVAATNRNLAAEVELGNFREDLFFRLSAAHVRVPPLRDRLDDLPLLAAHFLGRATPPRSVDDIPEPVLTMFRAHHWPGNVRELQNAVQRFLLTPERPLGGHMQRPAPANPQRDTPAAEPELPAPQPLRIARREASDTFERRYLQELLAKTEGNIRRSAAIAEVSRQLIQRLLRRHGM